MIPGRHFRDELSNEGLSMQEALCVLRSGAIYAPPEPGSRRDEWKWRIEGREPGGKWLIIVFTFRSEGQAFLITTFSEAR